MNLTSAITIVPYNKNWPKLFSEEKKSLEAAFASIPIKLSHIGSTSVPGLCAKPVIDILGEAADLESVDSCNDALKALGYEPLGEFGIHMRRFFNKKSSNAKEISFNLHIFQEGDYQIARHLLFCDYLRRHPEDAAEYGSLKKQLSLELPEDTQEYISGKNHFIKEIDYKALMNVERSPFTIRKPVKTRWSENEFVEAMGANRHLKMTFIPRYSPAMDVKYYHGATLVYSSLRDRMFNYVLDAQIDHASIPTEIVRRIVNSYSDMDLPFSWWIFPSSQPETLSESLKAAGLTYYGDEIGMVLNLTDYCPKISTTVHIRRAVNPLDIFTFDSIQVSCGENQEAYKKIFRNIPPALYQEGSPVEIYIGYAEGRAVAAGLLVLYGNVAGIYSLATHPNDRGKGYATAIIDAMIYRSKYLGFTIATLQTPSGKAELYKKFGFKDCCLYRQYINMLI